VWYVPPGRYFSIRIRIVCVGGGARAMNINWFSVESRFNVNGENRIIVYDAVEIAVRNQESVTAARSYNRYYN